MDELAKAISDEYALSNPKLLQEANEKWTLYCVRGLRDEQLKRGLAISEAISNYVAELESTK